MIATVLESCKVSLTVTLTTHFIPCRALLQWMGFFSTSSACSILSFSHLGRWVEAFLPWSSRLYRIQLGFVSKGQDKSLFFNSFSLSYEHFCLFRGEASLHLHTFRKGFVVYAYDKAVPD